MEAALSILGVITIGSRNDFIVGAIAREARELCVAARQLGHAPPVSRVSRGTPLRFATYRNYPHQYSSFQPSLVNVQWNWNDPQLDTLLAEANRRLGELNGLSFIVSDLDRYIEMHVVKEAQTSSRIECTQTGMDEPHPTQPGWWIIYTRNPSSIIRAVESHQDNRQRNDTSAPKNRRVA